LFAVEKPGLRLRTLRGAAFLQATQQPERPADSDPQRVVHKAVERVEVSHIRGNAEGA
jgi:hypothetical protein